MSDKLKNIDFENLLQVSTTLPMVHIDREEFLRCELKKHCDQHTIEKAINNNPAFAGISSDIIDKVADSCINYETIKVSGLSFVAGLPGGIAMVGTIPADFAQFYGHIIRIIQKLAYLYGWQDLNSQESSMDSETGQLLTLFTGIMFGVKGAVAVVKSISTSFANKTGKTLARKALTQGVIYPIVKKVATSLGIKMTKELFAKGVSKIIPVVGGFVSGGITFASYKPMAIRLKKHLSEFELASVDYYEKLEKQATVAVQKELINVDFSEIAMESVEKDLETE